MSLRSSATCAEEITGSRPANFARSARLAPATVAAPSRAAQASKWASVVSRSTTDTDLLQTQGRETDGHRCWTHSERLREPSQCALVVYVERVLVEQVAHPVGRHQQLSRELVRFDL